MASHTSARWWLCPDCGCEHFLLTPEADGRDGGPWCSRCALHARRTKLCFARQLTPAARRAARLRDHENLGPVPTFRQRTVYRCHLPRGLVLRGVR
jgi:hypothetical protein